MYYLNNYFTTSPACFLNILKNLTLTLLSYRYLCQGPLTKTNVFKTRPYTTHKQTSDMNLERKGRNKIAETGDFSWCYNTTNCKITFFSHLRQINVILMSGFIKKIIWFFFFFHFAFFSRKNDVISLLGFSSFISRDSQG